MAKHNQSDWRARIRSIGSRFFAGPVDIQFWVTFWIEFDEEIRRRWAGTYDAIAIYQLRQPFGRISKRSRPG